VFESSDEYKEMIERIEKEKANTTYVSSTGSVNNSAVLGTSTNPTPTITPEPTINNKDAQEDSNEGANEETIQEQTEENKSNKPWYILWILIALGIVSGGVYAAKSKA
jgi:cobalamin biosynthesis Mg chelatase CobN